MEGAGQSVAPGGGGGGAAGAVEVPDLTAEHADVVESSVVCSCLALHSGLDATDDPACGWTEVSFKLTSID